MIKYIFICFFIIQNIYTQKIIHRDTLISYDIKGFSTEGAGVEALYVDKVISKSTTYIFRGTGQTIITYHFEKNGRIKVEVKQYYYKVELKNVKSDDDMILYKELNYYIDTDGNLIGRHIQEQDRMDIFEEFKKIVPFALH